MSEMKSFDNAAYVANEDDVGESKGGRVATTANRDVDQMTPEEIRLEKRAIMKNILLISFSFLLLFTAFQSMSALQSSINKVCNLGSYSNSVIYAALVLSCMFLPTIVIKRFTVKWGMVVCMLGYSVYIAVQFYPSFSTLIPGAIVVGIGAAPMWSAKCTYLTHVGNRFAHLSRVDVEPIIVRFFGIFFLFFQSSSIWGPLISSAVLGQDEEQGIPTDVDVSHCGIHHCPDNTSCSQQEPSEGQAADKDNFSVSKSELYVFAGIYLACALLSAVIVSIFVDPLKRFGEEDREGNKEKLSGKQLLVATFKHMKKTNQIFIIPLTVWSGIEQGFFFSDYTAGFVSCVLGVHNVGYVFITYGVCDALCSVGFGWLIKYVGRISIFVFGAVINCICIIVMFQWTPDPQKAYVFFVLAGLWGMADAVWQTQINALYGVLFENDEEAAFSNYRLWESIGFIIAFVLQTQVCIYSKLWVVVAVLVLGMGGYFVVERMERKKKSKNFS